MSRQSIFVFGSNLSGVHGAGSARAAFDQHGAEMGVGYGPTGNAYAIPTKDRRIETMPIEAIEPYVDDFILYAKRNPELDFNVVAIGCGLAGFAPADIAPMFKCAPDNVKLPVEFLIALEGLR